MIPAAESGPARFLPLRRESVGIALLLFLLGFNAYIAVAFVYSYDYYSDTALGTWRFYVLTYLCIMVAGFLHFLDSPSGMLSHPLIRRWLAVAAGVVALMTIRSVIAGEPMIDILWKAVIYLSLLASVLVGLEETNWPVLNRMFVAHTLLGSAYLIGSLIRNGAYSRLDILDLPSCRFLMNDPIYASMFLLYSFAGQSNTGRMVAILGYLAGVFFTLAWQSRMGTALAIVQVFMLLFILWRCQRLRLVSLGRAVLPALAALLALCVVLVLLPERGRIRSQIRASQELLVDYWTWKGGVVDTTMTESRWEEARILVGKLSWDEWLMGRGVAATWTDYGVYGGERRTMVHVGYLHYIFQGGVLFLGVMLVPLVWGVRALLRSANPFSMAAGGCVVVHYARMIVYGLPDATFAWVFLGIIMGRCAASWIRGRMAAAPAGPVAAAGPQMS